MLQLKSYLTLAALLTGAGLLSSCGGNAGSEVSTSTPTSTLGTDSATAKMGGQPADTTSRSAAPAGTAPGRSQ